MSDGLSPDEIERRMTTYMMLGALMREEQRPSQPQLRLTRDGWEMIGGDLSEALPLHVDLAYEASGFDQRVLDETRKLCGELRLAAKKSPVVRAQLDDLRAGLARARALKPQA